MASLLRLNPMAELARGSVALQVNLMAAKGLLEIMRTNLGPKGTMKMFVCLFILKVFIILIYRLVSGSGDIKISKDGNVLLNEMQIKVPTASMIAKTSTAQNDITGDGTTSVVMLIGELLKQAENYITEGVHPSVICDGLEMGKNRCLKLLEEMKVCLPLDKDLLLKVAGTALRTKVAPELADHLTEIVVDAVLTIRRLDRPIDLLMVEVMTMQHCTEMDTKLIRGLVLDHGVRHPDMKKLVRNAYILACNVSLEFEKPEVNVKALYKNAEEREKLLASEREFIIKRVQKIIDLKRKVCDLETLNDNVERNFVVINQKGIDPISLDLFAKAGIPALRRAKRRNMERLMLACGCKPVNSVENLTEDVLGKAGLVHEVTLGEDKYTFVEEVENPKSVTILIKGPSKHAINQVKDAVDDGLQSVKNTFEDGCVIPGAGAFEVAAYCDLMTLKETVDGRVKMGIQAFADALMIIVKSLAQNAGFHPVESCIKLQDEHKKHHRWLGLNLYTGDVLLPVEEGVFDNYCVKKSILNSSVATASNLLMVDEIIRGGMSTKGT
ncbi:T-complex protein 1 subunit zeta [Trichinella pseudospiralis]|uniref:T-complex protein 1 subunit zeta n=1 Tax=Trichinella pseudospiralis TaxID=6337 RepID=A0A0V1I2S6_TRIPS|nr:T-complex protein 1 subunit zeta [Trichinella pseudospiralis]KRZ17208.1 T-complex protein 1 subunit zeta [Trichinella pseudospiralis]KRZ40563.1 T-complex protein 1 subunit zeta [Trichinella pseudospiralis]